MSRHYNLEMTMTDPRDKDAEIRVIGEVLGYPEFSIDEIQDHDDNDITAQFVGDDLDRLYSAVSVRLAEMQYDAACDYDDSSDWK